MPPGRPIVSDCDSISKTLLDSYIKNTYDCIEQIINVSIPENSLLITLDVESMCTNIDQNKGILTVKEVLNNFYLSDYITELLELSL